MAGNSGAPAKRRGARWIAAMAIAAASISAVGGTAHAAQAGTQPVPASSPVRLDTPGRPPASAMGIRW